MNRQLLRLLACPYCGGSLQMETPDVSADAVVSGTLHCTQCAEAFPISNGIPRFVPGDTYVSSFSFEWKRWRRTQFDPAESLRQFIASTGKHPSELRGRLVLDAGCGSGRFMDLVARAGAEVVGIDLSFAVEVAAENLGAFDRCHLVQADLMRPPFRPGSFDFVYSIGVLHHTPDTRAAFRQLAQCVAPGGEMSIWVYPRRRLADTFRHFPDRVNEVISQDSSFRLPERVQALIRPVAGVIDWTSEASSGLQRAVTTRLPPRWLYALCHAAIPLYYVYRMPLFYPLRLLTKVAMHPNPEWRVLDTFDWYSPRYQWKHTFEEVRSWYEESGFGDIRLLPRAVAVTGKARRLAPVGD
jgi:SAM-dependent methyltransferase